MITEGRTAEEILARYEERKPHDLFGFECGDYLDRLPFELAKPYLKDGVTEEQWEAVAKPATRDAILEEMKEYLPFAFEKAYGERGLSALRSLQHYIAWIWLLNDGFSDEIEYDYENNYHSYGLPILIKIAQHYGWEIPTQE